MVCTKYEGESLDTCMRDCPNIEDGKNLAKFVHKKVGTALCSMHKSRLVFIDPHPGNIALSTDHTSSAYADFKVNGRTQAKLIDVESVTEIEQPISSKVKHVKFGHLPQRGKEMGPVAMPKIDWMSLTHVVAAILFQSFRSCQGYDACNGWKKKISDHAQKCFRKHGVTIQPGSNDGSLDELAEWLVESLAVLARPAESCN